MHKPATVSGGGKSEISKRLEDMIKYFLVRSCRVLRVCVLPCVVCVRAGATSRKRGGRCCSNVMTQLLERRYGPVYVNDITKDFDMVESIFAKDFSGIMAPGATVCVKPTYWSHTLALGTLIPEKPMFLDA